MLLVIEQLSMELVVDCSSSTNAHPEVMRKWSEKIHAGG
jgi:hypothetical protein